MFDSILNIPQALNMLLVLYVLEFWIYVSLNIRKIRFLKIRKAFFEEIHFFFYKQSIFDPRRENCLSFSKTSPQKIV